jgi:hypothetical protein
VCLLLVHLLEAGHLLAGQNLRSSRWLPYLPRNARSKRTSNFPLPKWTLKCRPFSVHIGTITQRWAMADEF